MNRSRAPQRRLATTTIALACALSGCGGSGPVDGARALAHVEKMVALGPRPAGSDALHRSAQYLSEQLRALGLAPQEQTWKQTVVAYGKPVELDLRNVWVEIPGSDPQKGNILLLAAHYDTKLCAGHPDPAHNFEFTGAIDGAGGSAVLLELARVLKDRKDTVPNVWLAWFDGEESLEYDWKDDTALLGSRYFVATMAADPQRFPNGLAKRLKVMVLLDLIGSRDFKIDKDVKSNADLLGIFERAATEMGEAQRMFAYESPMTDDHIPFKDRGVAVIDLIDFRWRSPQEWAMPAEEYARRGVTKPADGAYTPWWHTADDNLTNVSADALAFAGNLIWHALPEIERHPNLWQP